MIDGGVISHGAERGVISHGAEGGVISQHGVEGGVSRQGSTVVDLSQTGKFTIIRPGM